jgi:ATP-binding cassette subfamily B (MDR/TAP) protein 7
MVALGLLISAKVLNVCVPFMFKLAVDNLGPSADFTNTVDTVTTYILAILIGCKIQKTLYVHTCLQPCST